MSNKQGKNSCVKTKKNSNIVLYIIAILLIMVTAASSTIGLYSWAKYKTAINGETTAQVAKWNFKLIDGVPETSDIIDFKVTRTDTNTTVSADRVAPGTYGQFEIGMDARGTETILNYVIDIELTNKPTNMKFYSNSEKTKEISVTNDKMTIKGFMSLEDVKEIKTETIYWDWPYTTGESNTEIVGNDKKDTQDAGKTVKMAITVTGTEVLEKPTQTYSLADVAKIGDLVNYNAASGNGFGKSYTTNSSLTGNTTESIFSSSDTMRWKVMSVNKVTGTVELMADIPTKTTLKLTEKTGYNNAESILNDISAIYGYGEGSIGGRSITIEDVNRLENYTPPDDSTSYTYTSGTFVYEDGTEIRATKDNPIIMSYTSNTSEKSTDRYYEYNTTNFSSRSFWLASRSIRLLSGICRYTVRSVNSGSVYDSYLLSSNTSGVSREFGIVPVISLKANIQTTGQNASGAWILVID